MRPGNVGSSDTGYRFIQGRLIYKESWMIFTVRESTGVLSVISFKNRIESM